MNYLDNAIKQIAGAQKDLAADNREAAAAEYGRVVTMSALKEQIALLINRGNHMSCFVDADRTSSRELWDKEVNRARELIK